MLTACRMAPVVKKSINSSAASRATLAWASSVLGAEMRSAHDAGHAEQRAVGAGLGLVDVHAAEMSALQPFHQGRPVVDAAARS